MGGIHFGGTSYRMLFQRLHETVFTHIHPRDENRAKDGVELRRRFLLRFRPEEDYDYYIRELNGPCSVLEMITALAIKCEETIMDDPSYGDRTRQWFWRMINNLGLGAMSDGRFDVRFVDDKINTLLSRRYNFDGSGGLFTIRQPPSDMRKAEIWHQLCWYLDTIT